MKFSALGFLKGVGALFAGMAVLAAAIAWAGFSKWLMDGWPWWWELGLYLSPFVVIFGVIGAFFWPKDQGHA